MGTKPATMLIDALTARTRFGEIMEKAEKEQARFVQKIVSVPFYYSCHRGSRRNNQAFNFEIAPMLLCLPKIEHDLLVQPAFSRGIKSQR